MTSASVLEIFKKITTIPRESGHEGPMTDYLMSWAAQRKLEARKDETGNVCIVREAAKGYEDVPAIALQAHQDMVCEKKAGFVFDFAKDPIPYEIKDGWMVAENTTLGADDGIGVAACLALLESDVPTGKLECVFTISEETGMDGAFAMKEGFFEAKTLINLDSEDEGQLFIGCAGGEDTTAYFHYGYAPFKKGWKAVELSIEGGLGGHSGDDINKNRANTVQILSRFLRNEFSHGQQLVIFTGGGKPNAIAREARAVVSVPDPKATKERFAAYESGVRAEFAQSDPNLVFACKSSGFNEKPMAQKVAEAFISALAECPHGVVRMSPDIEGLVQTSTNLAAVVMCEKQTIKVVTSQRSSVVAELDAIVEEVAEHFRSAGADVDIFGKYPGWNPNLDSRILHVCKDAYRKLFDTEPLVLAIHAGLECGLLLEKFPGLDMISFGPTLRGVHTPGEKLELASLDKFVALLQEVVCNFR